MNEPIFILSDARTGSTLLRVILDTHPAICSPAELSLGLVCEDLYHLIESTLGQALLDQSAEARTELCLAETRRIVEGVLQKYCALKSKRRWCEKTPRNLRSLATLRAVFPDARYISLYRHCLDAVRSLMTLSSDIRYDLRGYLDAHGGRAVPALIERWCDRADDLLAFESAAGMSLRVRYEDLVGDPEAALRRILAFLGEEWQPDLLARVFTSPHDAGDGDPKIAGTSAVRADSVGGGRCLDLSETPPALLDRMRRTLTLLGYDEQPADAATTPRTSSRPVRADVGALFNQLFSERLERHRHWLRAPRHDVGVIVRGPGGGAWTLQFDASGARFSPSTAKSTATLAIDSTDLLDAVNGRFTFDEVRMKFAVEGDLRGLDRALADRVVQALFGDDLRTDVSGA